MASKPSVSLRLGMEGKEEIKTGFAEIGASGDAAAKRAASAFQRAGEDIAAATQRQTQAAQKLAAVNPNVSMGTEKQGPSTSLYRDYQKQLADTQRQVEALKNAIDPLRVAQAQYDKEVQIANGLLAQGAISEEMHAASIALSGRVLTDATARLAEHTNGLGLNRMQFVVGTSAVHRFADSIMAGTPPLRAFMMQAGDVATVLQADDGGVAGALSKVRMLLNPTTLAIAAATAIVVVATAGWISYTNAIEKFNALSQGSGRLIGITGDALEANAEKAAAAGDISVSAARDIETAYVQTGKIGGDVLVGLTAVTNDFAAATQQKAGEASKALAAAFADPAKGADDLTEKYGLLDAKTLDYIHTLVEQGHEQEAQAVLLKALQAQFDGAAEHANVLARAWHSIANEASGAFNWIGKAIDRALGGGDAAEKLASLQAQRSRRISDSYGMEDTSDLDKQIADLKAQLAKQTSTRARADAVPALALVDSYTGADKLSDLKTNLAAINKVLTDGGKAAGLNADQLKDAREAQEAYTRAIQTYLPPAEKQRQIDALDAQIAAARTPAQKQALAAQKERVEQSGKIITAAQAESDATSKAAAAFATASKAGENHAAALAKAAQTAARKFAEGIASVTGDLAKTIAANDDKIKSLFADDFKKTEQDLAGEQKDRLAPSDYALKQIVSQRESLQLSQAELDTIRMGSDERQIALDKVAKTIDLQREGVDLGSDQAKAVLAGVEAQDRLTQAITRAGAAMQEVRDFGGQFIDDLASGKNLAQDLYQEFIKLAALNPLKNLINGNNNLPTLSSIFSLFGAGASLPSASTPLDLSQAIKATAIPGFATGTDDAPGGLAWVGENGKELLNLPKGASITPAAQSRQVVQAAANDRGGDTHNHYYIEGNLLTPEFWAQIQAGDDNAAAKGATGGAQLAAARAGKRARFRIPGR